MEITWYGLSCFRLKEGNTVVLCDPFDKKIGTLPKVRADIVTISSNGGTKRGTSNGANGSEGDYAKLITGEPMFFNGPGEYETHNVFISGMSTYQKLPGSEEIERNTSFFFEMGDFIVGHLGALGEVPKQSQIESLKISEVDILLVPVGGGSMLDPTHAVEIVGMLEPKLVVPMLYSQDGFSASWVQTLEPVDKFLKELGFSEPESQTTLKVSKSGLPDETQVVLLEKS
ncbi:MAG: MBL fold metallo-hydrolase [Chloroflexota bacterium]